MSDGFLYRRSPFPGFLEPLNGRLAFLRFVGLFRPTGTSRVSVFRALRYIRSVAISSTFCIPRCSPSLFGFLPWSAWVPLPLGRFRSFRFATSLRHGPWLIVSFELAPVLRFGSAPELCSRLFRALSVARFHPCYVLALSPDFLSPFEVSGFLCPARPCGLPFPLRSFDCHEVSLHFRSWFPSVLPERLSLSGVSSFHLSSNSGSISVMAYLCSPKGL